LLVYLRFARTRSKAQAMIESSHMRINGERVSRPAVDVVAGNVLTFAQAGSVRIIEILMLPERRSSAEIARSHYRELDRSAQNAIAETNVFERDHAP